MKRRSLTKSTLKESEMPREWYNVRADMKNKPAPLLNPATLKPMTAQELGAVFCEELVKQELDNDNRYIEIPEKIRDFYKMYRPAPLVRAYCLRRNFRLRRRSIINSKETILREVISLILPLPRLTMQKSRA